MGTVKQNKNNKTQKKLNTRTNAKIKKVQIANSDTVMKDKGLKKEIKQKHSQPKELKNNNKPKSKSKALVNKIKNTNYKQVQKDKNTNQDKSDSNLTNLPSGSTSRHSHHVEGIIKIKDPAIKATSKNNKTDIKSNVIGKKTDVKFITSKNLIIACVVLIVLLSLSLISNVILFMVFKHKADNPLFTITKEATIEINDNASNLISFVLPRNILPASKLNQKIELYANSITSEQVVRVRGIFTSGDGERLDIELELDENWIKNENDSYYYLTNPIALGEKCSATQKIMLPSIFDLEVNGKNLHVVTIIFESLNHSESLVRLVWETVTQDILDKMFE